MFNNNNVFRDILFAIGLFFLIKFALTFDYTTKKPLTNKTTTQNQNDDISHTKNIETLKQQVSSLEKQVSSWYKTEKCPFSEDLQKLNKQIQKIEQDNKIYAEKTAKTNTFLGPIGSAATILQERKAKKDLQLVSKEISEIAKTFCAIKKKDTPNETCKTLDEFIKYNDKMISN